MTAGGIARFGAFGVGDGGVSYKKTVVPFAEIDTFADASGGVRLKRRGSWFDTASVQAATVPNLAVMMALVGERRAGR